VICVFDGDKHGLKKGVESSRSGIRESNREKAV
jgi:hypothetical protein